MDDRGNGSGRSENAARLGGALDRLDTAVGRLQGAFARRARQSLAEQERLAGELGEVRASHALLQDEARVVSTRLDGAIGRLRAVMEL